MKLFLFCIPFKKLVQAGFLIFIFLVFPGVTFSQAPTITSNTPNQICTGGQITISGTNFTNVNTVIIAGSAATFVVNNSTTITATANSAGTGNVSVTNPIGTATSTGTVTVLQAPSPILTDATPGAQNPFSNCDGNSTYTITVSNSSTCTGSCTYSINWGDGPLQSLPQNWPSGAQVTHTYNSQGYFNIVLTITSSNGCSSSKTYSFYNGTNPIASISTSTSTTGLCAPASIQFQIGNWFGNSTGTTYQLNYGDLTTPVTLPHPLNPTNTLYLISHLYTTSSCPSPDYTATLQAINGCFTTTYTLNQIVIRKKPIPDFTANPNPACLGSAICFTNNTIAGYSGNTCINTSTYDWDFGDGSPHSNQQTPPCHVYASVGTYTVTLKASNNACGDSSKSKTVTVSPLPPPPTVNTPVIYCQNQTALPLTASGVGLLWYTTLTGIGSPTPIIPSTTTAGVYTYFVTQTINGCESPKASITVTINAAPPMPTVTSPVQYCQNQTASQLTASGTNLLWYVTSSGGTGSAIAPTPSTANIGTTTYYVSQSSNGCEGPRASINVIINSLANAPTVNSPVNYCQNDIATPLTASGSSLLWYSAASGGTGNATAPTPSTATAGSTTYYVSQLTGCGESPRSPIVVIVTTRPTATISYSSTNLCNVNNSGTTPNPPINVTFSGTTGGTYSVSPTAGLLVNSITGEINPSGAAAGTYTITYTISGSGSCPPVTATSTVIVNGTPAATISYPAICSSDIAANVVLTGSAGGNYTSTAGLTINNLTGTINPSTSTAGSYIVTYTISPSLPCPGFITTTNVTITQPPTATISYSPTNLCNVTNSSTTPNPPINVTFSGTTGGTYSVSPTTGLLVNSITGEINPSGATAGTYTITYTMNNIGSCPPVTATATVIVNGTPSASINYPPMCSSDISANVGLTGSAGGTFTSTAGLTINNLTGTINPSTSTPGSYVVTYTISPTLPCPGFSTTTTVIITQAPTATISYPVSNLCNVFNSGTNPNPPINVGLTGTTGGFFSISPSTGLSINVSTGQLTPSGATSGTYTISYTIVAAGGCLDFSTTTSVSVSDAPAASINYPTAICTSDPITVPGITGSTGGTFSSTTGIVINNSTGSINPGASTPGTYVVTYTISASPPCPGFITTASVIINESPTVTFPYFSMTICSSDTLVYNPVSSVPSTIYNWAVVGSLPTGVAGNLAGSTLSTDTNISISFTNTGTTSQTISIEVIPVNPTSSPCNGIPYYLTAIINPIPSAPIVTDTVGYCLGTPGVPLTATALPGNQLLWYDVNMNLLPTAPTPATNAPVQFIYYVSQISGQCESPKSIITAIVYPTPKITSSSFTNPTSCGLPTGSITLNILDLNNNPIPNRAVIVYYDKFQTHYAIPDTTDASGNITISLTAGTYTGFYIEINGCFSQRIPDIFILRDPTPPAIPTAGYNPPVCSEKILNLSASSATSNITSPVYYVWVGPAFGSLPDTTINTVFSFPSASTSVAGTYIVYAIQNNCISPDTSFEVIIHQSPTKPIITTINPLCIGDNLNLQSVSSLPNGPPNATLLYTWNGPGRGFPINLAHAEINNVIIQDEGIYTITVYSPGTGCSSQSDTLIMIGGYPIVNINAGNELVLPAGQILDLNSTIVNAGDPHILPMKIYEWSPNSDIQCNDPKCSAPLATIKNDICYSVKAINIYGCYGRDTICVKVFCENTQVFIPNAFTPNGDGFNDILMVRGKGIAKVKSFRIFNRWGEIVFERNDFPPNDPHFGWDGRIKGIVGEPAVYVYTAEAVCENGSVFFYKGNTTILK